VLFLCLRPDRTEALSDAFFLRLSVAYIGRNSRTERPRRTKIGTGVAHVARDSDTTFKVKGELVADVLNSQHAGTGATWRMNTIAGGGGISWRPPAYSLFETRFRQVM